jgi:hypothetical protein
VALECLDIQIEFVKLTFCVMCKFFPTVKKAFRLCLHYTLKVSVHLLSLCRANVRIIYFFVACKIYLLFLKRQVFIMKQLLSIIVRQNISGESVLSVSYTCPSLPETLTSLHSLLSGGFYAYKT